MKTKYTTSHQEFYSPSEHLIKNYNYDHYNQPIKSPSPDKKSANIIASTKSPEVAEIKRYHHTPDKELNSMWMSRQSGREKPFSIATPSKIAQKRNHVQEKNFPDTNITDQRNLSSGMRNTKIEIIASSSPEDFDDKYKSSRTRQVIRSESNELDYLKLLKSKEDTIRELKDIIAMIKRSQGNAEQQLDASTSQLRQRIHELTEQTKTLRIENQHLYNIIEKTKKSASGQKEESSSRKVRELQDTLRQNKLEYQDRYQNFERQMNRLKEDLKRLQIQNQSLLKLLKQKEDNLGSSSMSIQSKSSEKEKLSLVKIKEQYSQNLKLMRENFAREIQQIQNTSMYQLENMSNKIDELTLRLQNVEDQRDAIQRKLPDYEEKMNVQEEFHKQKLRYHEIETLMLERHNSVEKDLLNQKKNNERLINQLSKVTKAHEQLHNKSHLYWQELSILRSSKIKDGELQNIVNERNQLYDQNGRLKLENSRLGAQFEEYKLNNNRDIRELENKIQTIVTEYEKRLMLERKNANEDISKVKEYYEKDKEDTEQKVTMAIQLYQKQKEQYQKAVIQKNSEIVALKQKIDSLEYEHSRCKENGVTEQQLGKIQFQCQQFKRRCLNSESEIEKISSELLQMDIQSQYKNRINLQLQEQVGHLQQEREDLRKKLGQAQMSNDDLAVRLSRKERQVVDLQQNINTLQRNLYEQERSLLPQIQNLKRQNSELQHKQESLLSTLYGKQESIRNQEGQIDGLNKVIDQMKRKQKDFVSFNQFDFMEDELNELKRVVQEYLASNNSKNQSEIVEQYYKLTYNYQVKIEENLKYIREIDELKKQLIKREDQKNKMQEQLDYLKNATNIYEHELKERRLLYDQLLQQKTRIEKEALMSKKIKIEQSQRQSTYRTNVNDITTRIDRLLELETKRNQNMKGLYIVKQASS